MSSHLSVLHLPEAVLEPRLLVVCAASPQRLRLDCPDRGRRSARRPRGRGGEEALQGRRRSWDLTAEKMKGDKRGQETRWHQNKESQRKSFCYLQHLMDLHTGLRGVLHSDLHHGGGRGRRCTDNALLNEALKFNTFFVLTNPLHDTAQWDRLQDWFHEALNLYVFKKKKNCTWFRLLHCFYPQVYFSFLAILI